MIAAAVSSPAGGLIRDLTPFSCLRLIDG